MSDLRMPDLNRVLIAGRLTRDPDLRYSGDSKPFCKFAIANTRYYKDRQGEKREDTAFVDVVAFSPQAEWAGERLSKGRPVLVEGSLSSSKWDDRETGQKRSKVEVKAQRVTPLDWDGPKEPAKSSGTATRAHVDDPPQPQPQQSREPGEDDIPF